MLLQILLVQEHLTDTKLYVPVVTLSTQGNSNLLQQLKSGFKRVFSWNKYLSKPELLRQNPNLNHLVEPSFQGVSRLSVSAFQKIHKEHDQRNSSRHFTRNCKSIVNML